LKSLTHPICACFSVLVFCQSVFATPSLEDYGKLPTLSKLTISPNGERIAYRLTESDNSDYISVYSLLENKPITSIRIGEINPQRIFFGSNDHLILLVTKHVNWQQYKHDFHAGSAYTLNIKTSKVEPLVKLGEPLSGKRVIYSGQSIGNIVGFSTDRSEVYMGAWVGDTYYDGNPDYALLKVNIDGKGRPKIINKGRGFADDYFMDHNGELVAIEKHNKHTNRHSITSLLGKNPKTVYEYTSELRTHSFVGLSSDFKSLIYFRTDDNDALYYKLSLENGESTTLEIPIEKSFSDVLVDDSNVVIGTEYTGLFPSYGMFDSELDKRLKEISKLFPEHNVQLKDWTSDWEKIVVYVEGSNYAGSYILVNKNGDLERLASSRPNISREAIHPLARVTFKARDGLKIPTILTIPNLHLESMKNLPTVILPHGGPAAQDQIGFDFMAQALASKGFLVAQPQYRGSSGFGRNHLEAGYGEWGKKMQDDLSDTVAFLVRKGISNPDKVCIAGASYGGYAALAGATFTPDLYQCAFSLAGVSHLHKMLAEDKSRYGKDSEVVPYFTRSILDGAYDKKALHKVSPYFYAENVTIPVMLVHGQDDTIVDFNQSKLMHKALKKAGKDVTLITLKDEDHHLQKGSTRIQALEALVNFVDQYIGEKN